MAEEEVVSDSRMKNAMDELMKTEAGRELAEKLRGKLKELNEQFKGLSGEDKKTFSSEFREKFSESFSDLKDSFKAKLVEDSDGDDGFVPPPTGYFPQPNYMLFLVAITLVILVFG